MSDAFKTNVEGEVEFSDVVELGDARISEAIDLSPESSAVVLYRRFQYNGRKVSTQLPSYVP